MLPLNSNIPITETPPTTQVIIFSKLNDVALNIKKQPEIIVRMHVITKKAKTPLLYFNANDKINNTKITAIDIDGTT